MKEFMIRVFDNFLRDFQIDLGSPVLRPFEAVKHLEIPEMYEDAQILMLLTRSINHLAGFCGLDIALKDILEPKPKRTKKILNHLIVFWKFYVKKLGGFQVVEQCLLDEQNRANQLKEENNILSEKIANHVETLTKMQPNKDELLHEITLASEKIEEKRQLKEGIASEYQLMKTKESSLREKISNLDVEILSSKEQLEQVDQMLVKSPDRLSGEVQSLKERIREEDKKAKEMKSKCEVQAKKIALFQKIDSQAFEEIDGIHKISQEINTAISSYELTKKKIEEEMKNLHNLELDVEKMQKQLGSHQQKAAKFNLNTIKQKEALHEILQMHESDVKRENNLLATSMEAVRELKLHMEQYKNTIYNLKKNFQLVQAEGQNFRTNLLAQVEQEQKQLTTDCDETIELLKKEFNIVNLL